MAELPHRKELRLKEYDHSRNGAYFVTLCTRDKAEIFSRICVGANTVRPYNITSHEAV